MSRLARARGKLIADLGRVAMKSHDDGLPEDNAGMKLMIHALVDGELDAAAALSVERRIAADPELAAEYARIVALQGVTAACKA